MSGTMTKNELWVALVLSALCFTGLWRITTQIGVILRSGKQKNRDALARLYYPAWICRAIGISLGVLCGLSLAGFFLMPRLLWLPVAVAFLYALGLAGRGRALLGGQIPNWMLTRRQNRGQRVRPQMPFAVIGNFIDIGVLTDLRRNLIDRGNRILESLGRGGILAMIVVQEPYPGDWGSTPQEHRESAVKALMGQLAMYEREPDEYEVALGGAEGMQKLKDSSMFREGQQDAQKIKQAMESGKARFLLGSLSTKCKVVAVLILQ